MRWLCCASLVVLGSSSLHGQDPCPTPRVMPRDELLEFMLRPRSYDIVPTPNWARFQTDVFLEILRAELAKDSAGSVIFITAEDWYQGFKQATGLTDSTVHIGTRLARDVGQAVLLDVRRNEVVRRTSTELQGRIKLAANARIFWPDTGRLPPKFSYRDSLTEPHLKVTNRRVVTFRLVELDNGVVVYDDMEGVYGRPTSGFWGTVLSVIGEAAVLESRLAAADSNLYVFTRGKKVVSMSVTATVFKNGRGVQGIPPELAHLEQRLRQPIDIEYLPHRC